MEQHRGFEFVIRVTFVDGRACGGNFIARPVEPEVMEMFVTRYGLHEMRMPIHVRSAPAGADMNTYPQQHFAQIARDHVDKFLSDQRPISPDQDWSLMPPGH